MFLSRIKVSLIIERYRAGKAQMCLAGISVRWVEDIGAVGSRVSPGAITDLNQKIFERTEEWRQRPLEAEYPYVFVDDIWLKRVGARRLFPTYVRRH